jgi:LuxR family transcriptional regulator, transcriptional activator of the bioluminescence operon
VTTDGGRAVDATDRLQLTTLLTREELAELLIFCNDCMLYEREEQLHGALVALGDRLGFEFVLYTHMASTYAEGQPISMRNLTNPVPWMEEYASHSYLVHDPVRRELEIRLRRGELQGAFVWDHYDRELGAMEEEIIARRRTHGLRQGFSAYCESPRHDVLFLVSFATAKDAPPSDQALLVGRTVVPHLNCCRKRLDLSARVARLTNKERIVAEWLVSEKSNREIARIVGISEATAKFHVAKILQKLETKTRLGAAAVIIAERCLA